MLRVMIGAFFVIPGKGAAAMSIQEVNFPKGQWVLKTEILEGSKKRGFFRTKTRSNITILKS